MPKATAGTVAFEARLYCARVVLPLAVGESVVLGDGEPAVLVPPPLDGGVVVGSGDVVGVVLEVGGLGVVVLAGGFGVLEETGGGLPVSSRGGGGGSAWVTTVVVVLPSGLTETTVVGALDDVVGDSLDGTPPTVDGPLDDGVFGTVCRPACEVPWPPVPPVPPAVVAGSGPASSATAANAVATTSPATPSTTYPVRFGLLLFGGAVSILVTGEFEADPSGRGIAGSSGVRERRGRGRESITAFPGGGTREDDLGGEVITVGAAFAQVVGLCDHCAESKSPERMKA